MKSLLKFSIILIASISFFLGACDIVTPPYTEEEGPPPDTSLIHRHVLLAEYTGARCGNCPRAAEKATALHHHYGDQLILLTVHAGPYAKPKGTEYSYDFRTPEGDAYDSFFGNSKAGNPNGMVSRFGYPNNHILNEDAWEGVIQELFQTELKMDIELESSIDTSAREISLHYKIKYLQDGSPNDNLVILIVEDSIVKYQTDYRKDPDDIPDYVHNHILRGSFTGAWGQPLNAAGINKGDEFEDTVVYKIPADKDWVFRHLSLIAFVHDNNESYEIWQVESSVPVLK